MLAPPMIFVTAPPVDLATSQEERMFYETSGLSQQSPITKGLQEMIVWFGGEFRQKTEAESKFDFTPLINTNRTTSGVMDFDKLVATPDSQQDSSSGVMLACKIYSGSTLSGAQSSRCLSCGIRLSTAGKETLPRTGRCRLVIPVSSVQDMGNRC